MIDRLPRLWLMVAPVMVLQLGLTLLLWAGAASAAPRAEPWQRWTAHDPQSLREVDHGAWDAFLMRYVRIGAEGGQRVAYGEVTPADRAALDDYVAQLARLPISRYARAEQLAFWINLHNALVVRLVLDHYPIASLRNLGGRPGLWTGAPWTTPLVAVEGIPVALSDIEHRILRPIWQDPRIHYALSCGARGCPPPAAGAVPGRRARAAAQRGGDGLRQRPRAASGSSTARSRSRACSSGTRRTSAARSAP